jgi:hypothetical protein
MKVITVYVIIDGSDPGEPAEIVGKMLDAVRDEGVIWSAALAHTATKHPEDGHEPEATCEDDECRRVWELMGDDGLANPNYDIEYRAWFAEHQR